VVGANMSHCGWLADGSLNVITGLEVDGLSQQLDADWRGVAGCGADTDALLGFDTCTSTSRSGPAPRVWRRLTVEPHPDDDNLSSSGP
jgi:hypothetical protein